VRGPVISKVPGLLEYLAQTQRSIDKVLVIFDADRRKPDELEREFKRRISKDYSFQVIPIIVVEELEAWLIADPAALRNLLGKSRDFKNPEKIRHPKAELQKLLSRTTRYTPEVARRLAQSLDLKMLERRCSSFREFQRALES